MEAPQNISLEIWWNRATIEINSFTEASSPPTILLWKTFVFVYTLYDGVIELIRNYFLHTIYKQISLQNNQNDFHFIEICEYRKLFFKRYAFCESCLNNSQ